MGLIKKRFEWLFSGHFKMERFGVTFGVLFLCMSILLSTIYVRKVHIETENMGNVVKYSYTYSSSLSQSTGQVLNIYCNDEHTECFVLLKYDNVANVVTDASQYELFLTGSNLNQRKEALLSKPSATIYMFGVSGYMGIYLVDTAGFPSQILDLVVRCNKLTGTMPTDIPEYEDKSFNDYDQFRIYFNPGASDYEPANFMNMGRMSVYEIYDAMVVKYQEDAIRENLMKSLDDMEAQLALIDEYTQRITAGGVIVPPAPMQIRGDKVIMAEDGSRKILVTDYIVQGGYNFDWYHGSVKAGYASSVLASVPNESSILNYIASQRTRAADERLSVDSLEWLRTDGTLFDVANATVQSDAMKALFENIESLKNAWQQYFTLKRNYQTTQMEELLLLEQNLFDSSVNYTVNAGAITLW